MSHTPKHIVRHTLLAKQSCLLLVLMALAVPVLAQSADSHAHLASGRWVKMKVAKAGIYCVKASDLGDLAGAAVSNMALYGLEGGRLSVRNSITSTDDLQQLSIEVVDADNDGLFNHSDYLLFYGEGPSVWRYQSSRQRVDYIPNTYASYNFYYLTVDNDSPKNIAKQNTTSFDAEATSYTAVGVWDNDELNTNHTGQIWVGERFNSTSGTRTISVDMPPLVSASQMTVKTTFASLSTASATFKVSRGSTHASQVVTASEYYDSIVDTYSATSSSSPEFTITYTPGESSAAGYLDYLQVNAKAQLNYNNKSMDIWSLETGLRQRYTITNAPSGLKVWDVTSPLSPIDKDASAGVFTDSLTGAHHYIAFTAQQAMSPVDIASIDNQDLRGATNPDMVIVCNPDFLTQAERLADIHRLTDGLEVVVATDVQVYNEFSSGRQDPMAIRKMMRYYRNRGLADADLRQTRFLLLFGRGSYDNRNLNGNNHGCLVTYESYDSFDDEVTSFCSDQVLGYLDDNESVGGTESLDIAIGRLPASSTSEATLLVDKIENYVYRTDLTEGSARGDWRTYVAMLADDADPSCVGDTIFTSSSEYTATQLQRLYPYLNVDKIYADAYIQQSGAVGSYYPDANNALRKRMNYGALLLNYVGHGSIQYIGTERYMGTTDMESYTNRNRLAFFVGSTCSIGRYDNPEVVSGAETFVMAENAGIGSIAAARPISHHQMFDTRLCANLLNPSLTVGQALQNAQNEYHQSQSINLLGDPALHISLPQKQVVVTAVNGRTVADNQVDTGTVLTQVTVEGEIHNTDGSLASNFNGTIYPIVYDRAQHVSTLANDNDTANVAFTQQKAVLYKGSDTVADGRFSYTFVVPRDVSYDYDFGRLSHYAKSGTIDAAGSYSNIVFGGFNQEADLSEFRPDIRLFMGDSNFIDGGLVGPEPTLYAVLSDSIGINAFGSGLGHDITAVLDDNPNGIITLNDFYETDFYDSHKGYVTYTLDKLSSGLHTLTLKAWNIYNYSNSATITFRVEGNDTAQIGRFYARPNPAHAQTAIYAEFNDISAIKSAHIDIYSMQGQLVTSFDPEVARDSYVVGPVAWDLHSASGSRVVNGIYLARIIIDTSDGSRLTQSAKIVVY